MTLSLPEDAESFIPSEGAFSDLHKPGVYCLVLERPENLAAEWDKRFEHRPDYWDRLQSAETVAYVGAASDVLHRLEEHKAGEKRKAAVVDVCEIDHLRNIWWADSTEEAFESESQTAIMLQNHHAEWYVHSR